MFPEPPVYATFVNGLPPKFMTLPLFDADLAKSNIKGGAAFAHLVEEARYLEVALTGSSYQALVDMYRDEPLAPEGKQIAVVGRLPSLVVGETRYVVLPDYMAQGMDTAGEVNVPLSNGISPSFVNTIENSAGTSSKSVFTIVLVAFIAIILLSILVGYLVERRSQLQDREIMGLKREERVDL